MRNVFERPNMKLAVLDAYIIQEIKKREDERRKNEEASRPRLHIDIPGWPDRGTDRSVPEDPRTPRSDDEEDDHPSSDVIRIDL